MPTDLTAEYHFKEEGRLIVGLSFANLIIPLNLTVLTAKHDMIATINAHCTDDPLVPVATAEDVPKLPSQQSNFIFTQDRNQSKSALHANINKYFCGNALRDSKRLLARYTELLAKLQAHGNQLRLQEQARLPRFAGGLALLGSLGFTGIMSSIAQKQITALQDSVQDLDRRQQLLVRVVDQQDLQVVNVQHNLEIVRSVLDNLNTSLVAQNTWLQTFVRANIFHRLVDAFEQDLEIAELAFESALNGKLHHRLLDVASASKALTQIAAAAKDKAFFPLINSAVQLLQLDTTFTLSNDTINLITHVPISHKSDHLRLLHYEAFQIPLDHGNLAVTITTPEPFLALDADQSFYSALSLEELAHCRRFAGTTLCPKLRSLVPVSVPACVLALYFKNKAHILQYCHITVHKERNDFIRLSYNTFRVYSVNPTVYNLRCVNGTSAIRNQRKTQVIKLPTDCSASLDFVRLIAATHIPDRQEIYSPFTWDISSYELLNNVSLDIATRILIDQKLNSEWSPPVPRTTLNAYKKELNSQPHGILNSISPEHLGLSSASMALVALLIVLALAFCLCRYYRAKTGAVTSPGASVVVVGNPTT